MTAGGRQHSSDLHEVREARRIAGHPAAWTTFPLDVHAGTVEAQARLEVPAIELYALADPERSIDAAALLRERVIADPPYWALVWTGARAIAAAVPGFQLAGRRVLDLGCGLGLSGLAALREGAAVTFGDYLDEPLEFVRATLDRLGATAEVRRIDFTRDEPPGAFDCILAADIVYDPSHYAPLAGYLDRGLAAGGTILLTESLRADARVFLEGIAALGYEDDRRALWVMEDGRRERTWLHALRRRR